MQAFFLPGLIILTSLLTGGFYLAGEPSLVRTLTGAGFPAFLPGDGVCAAAAAAQPGPGAAGGAGVEPGAGYPGGSSFLVLRAWQPGAVLFILIGCALVRRGYPAMACTQRQGEPMSALLPEHLQTLLLMEGADGQVLLLGVLAILVLVILLVLREALRAAAGEQPDRKGKIVGRGNHSISHNLYIRGVRAFLSLNLFIISREIMKKLSIILSDNVDRRLVSRTCRRAGHARIVQRNQSKPWLQPAAGNRRGWAVSHPDRGWGERGKRTSRPG